MSAEGPSGQDLNPEESASNAPEEARTPAPQFDPLKTRVFASKPPIDRDAKTEVYLSPRAPLPSAPSPAPEPPPAGNETVMMEIGFADLDDDEEIPASLKPPTAPTGIEDTLPGDPASGTGALRRPARRKRRLIALLLGLWIGLVAGLCLYVYGFFDKLWAAPLSGVVLGAPQPLRPGEGTDYPNRWIAAAPELLLGLADKKPLALLDLSTSQTWSSSADAPAPIVSRLGRLSLVAHPPLDPSVGLAWVESDALGMSTLNTQNLELNGLASGATEQTTVSAELPKSLYPYPPTVIDHPAPAVGKLLVTADQAANLIAWRVIDSSHTLAFAWQRPLEPQVGSLLCAPATETLWSDKHGSMTLALIALGANGVQVLNSADGVPLGPGLKWGGPFARRPLGLVYVPLQKLWLASDGKRLEVFTLRNDGTPESIFTEVLSADFGAENAAPRLLALSAPGHHDYVVVAPDGHGLWISRRLWKVERPFTLPEAAAPRCPLAAIDLNGNGVSDLVGLSASGKLWFIDGVTLAATTAETEARPGFSLDPQSPVLWNFKPDRQTVEAVFFATQKNGPFCSRATLKNKINSNYAKYYLSVSNPASASSTAQ